MEYCISQWVNGTDSQINYNHSVSKQKEKGKKKRLHKSKHFYLLARKNRGVFQYHSQKLFSY